MMITPSSILSVVRSQVYETDEAFYTDDELYLYMSEGEMQTAAKVGPLKESAYISGSYGVREYSMPSGCGEIYRLTWNSAPMTKIDITDIDRIEGPAYGFSGSLANPQYYYEDGDVIGLSPAPNAAQEIKVWYTYDPTPIDADSTSFSIADKYVYNLVNWVLYRCYMKDDDPGKGLNYLRLWTSQLAEAELQQKRKERSNQVVTVRDTSNYDPLLNRGTY